MARSSISNPRTSAATAGRGRVSRRASQPLRPRASRTALARGRQRRRALRRVSGQAASSAQATRGVGRLLRGLQCATGFGKAGSSGTVTDVIAYGRGIDTLQRREIVG
jgi:hypothetical protein